MMVYRFVCHVIRSILSSATQKGSGLFLLIQVKISYPVE